MALRENAIHRHDFASIDLDNISDQDVINVHVPNLTITHNIHILLSGDVVEFVELLLLQIIVD